MHIPPLQFARLATRRPHHLAARRILFSGLVLALAASLPAEAHIPLPQGAPPGSQGVAIVYDGATDYQAKGFIHALFVENLLGHFGLDSDIIPLKDYQPGELAHYRAAFFIGVAANAELPSAFLEDVRAYRQPFCWMGQHIGDLVNVPGGRRQFGFTFIEYDRNAGANRVIYKDTPLFKTESTSTSSR